MFHVSFHGLPLHEATLEAASEQEAVRIAVERGHRHLQGLPSCTGSSPTGGESWFAVALAAEAAGNGHDPAAAARGQAHVRVV